MNPDDAALWLSAVAVFAGGDYATTKIGLAQEGVEEAHPVSASMMGMLGADTSMLAGKAVVIGVAFTGYLYASRHPETSAYRHAFPLGLLLLGMGIVSHNVDTIQQARVSAGR